MITDISGAETLAIILLGAFIAGFTTGFAGFGTGLVASSLWFHALPALLVPPLVALASVAAQLVGLIAVRKAFDWRRATPFLVGGIVGVPLGVGALTVTSPDILRISVGFFLVAYAFIQLCGFAEFTIEYWGSWKADAAVGIGGGFLGGFAGLSGPLPLIWLQLRGGASDQQRAIYQPFNLIVLSLASVGMAMSGHIDKSVLAIAGLCLPVTLGGAWLGARAYRKVSERTFRRVVLTLLLVSGIILIGQTALER